MADPFSVTASTAGVISLGLTVCKGLLQYYEAFRSSGSTVATMYTQLISLTKTLTLIESILSQPSFTLNREAVRRVQGSMDNCHAAADGLGRKLEKLRSISQENSNAGEKIKSFIHRASYPFRESTLIRLKEIVTEFRNDLGLLMDALQLDASAVSLQRLDGIEDKLDIIVDNIASTSAIVHGFGQDLEAINKTLATSQLDEEHRRIHEWLCPPDPFESHAIARSKHEQLTNQWFLKSADYMEWVRAERMVLLLHGIPGCGKTILASSVIADLEERCLTEGSALLYFYFDFNDRQKQTMSGCLASLTLQLAMTTGDFRHIIHLYNECEKGKRSPSCQELLRALEEALFSVQKVYLVFDALDECTEGQNLVNLISESIVVWYSNTRVLVTGRRTLDLGDSSPPIPQRSIAIQQSMVDGDIQKYIESRLLHSPRLANWCKSDAIRAEIEEALTKSANGMFRWVAHQLEELQKCLTLASLRRTLKTLPKTLFETYDRIISQIDLAYHDMTFQILQWLCVARRPLAVFEVAETLAISQAADSTLDFDSSYRLSSPSDIFLICSSLLTSRSTNGTHQDGSFKDLMGLTHYSVKEYLYSKEISRGEHARFLVRDASAHNFVARSCIAYLLHFTSLEHHATDVDLPLAKYASEFWFEHVEASTGSEHSHFLDAAIITLLESKKAMLKIRQMAKPHYPLTHWTEKPALHWAAWYGFEEIAKTLIGRGAQLAEQDKSGKTALHEAVRARADNIVKLLLANGIDANVVDGEGGTALHYAVFNHDPVILKTLLGNGANPEVQSKWGKHPLFSATERGQAEIVKCLLDNHCDPNTFYQAQAPDEAIYAKSNSTVEPQQTKNLTIEITCLQVAVWTGNKGIVKMLLDAGATYSDEGLLLLSRGRIQDALQFVGQNGSFYYGWQHDPPDYNPVAEVLRQHAARDSG